MEDFYPLEVFETLSSKNLSILEEQLSHEALIISKLRQYSRQCRDSELKNLCSNLAEKHKSHYDTLLNYVISRSGSD
ncbi:MAG: hypothetical protein PHP19_00545 [Firmicutes bacterium]|nr:hypothetical protein [Bacillota bacterium]